MRARRRLGSGSPFVLPNVDHAPPQARLELVLLDPHATKACGADHDQLVGVVTSYEVVIACHALSRFHHFRPMQHAG